MPALAEVANAALPLRMGTVHVKADGLLGVHEVPRPSNQRFVLDDVVYHVTLSPGEAGTRLRIWAELGYVPYTAQAPGRRRDMGTVLRATRDLSRALFAVDPGQRILVMGETLSEEPLTVDGMVHEVVLFLQEARPFVRLVGRYL